MKLCKVAIIVGSDSDLPIVQETMDILSKADIPFEIIIASAHRSPEYLKKAVKEMEGKGIKIFITAAGVAAALPGVVASKTTLPVIGIPIDSSALKGIDALYSIVQMPAGIPVSTMAIGKAGAKNAGLLAISILSLSDKKMKKWLLNYRKTLCNDVIKKSILLRKKGYKRYIEELSKER